MLEDEAGRYKTLEGLAGFPALYWYGWHDDYKVMAFQLLGPSLQDLYEYCNRQFSLKTTLMIADQLLMRLKDLHAKDILHRDFKPQNCLLGCGLSGNMVYVTDFGLAGDHASLCDTTDKNIARQARLVGTARYASIRAHEGQGACVYLFLKYRR